MNQVIELMKKHRSIRQYLAKDISEENLTTLLEAGQWASTSSNLQAYSVIVVRDESKKRSLAALCGNQQHVIDCPVFLIFCADLHRIRLASQLHTASVHLDTVEPFLVATVDTALMAQNVLLAAESIGLGGVFIGGIRNNSSLVSELIALPELVYPVFGLCLGYPQQEAIPGQKPRLPKGAIVHEEQYQGETQQKWIQQYDQLMQDYYTNRTGGKRTESWSKNVSEVYCEPRRVQLKSFLEAKQFGLK